MPTPEASRAAVANLVDKFASERNLAQSEADVRAGYVDLLFHALGWNVYNDPGQVTNYRREGYVRGAGFVDVGLELRGQPVLFLEAKRFGRISSSAERTGDRTVEEKQAFRYARGKRITYAVLTNFERLHLFNADHERLIYAFDHPQEYLRNFEALWRLSPAEVERGSLPWWEGQLEKRDVDLEFLAALRRWRLQLANAIYEHNAGNSRLCHEDGSFDFDKLMAAVQRILDRLILIRYGDDREVLLAHDLLDTVLADYRSRGAYARPDHLTRAFADLSEMMDRHHNTTLFAPGHVCEQVTIPNETLAQVIEEMNSISFRKFTSDILGSTYESYLGTKLALRNSHIQDEERRDVRKGRGIFYTPRWVVEYIIDNSLGRRLRELEEEHGLHAIEKVRGLAVLDPACGSGSFLIYAYQVLAEFYRRLNDAIAQEQARLLANAAQFRLFDTLEDIKHLPQPVLDFPDVILKEHLFGVDLDPEAAEIAAVNLTMQAFADSRHKKLPLILNENIKVGNSLICGGESELKPHFGDTWQAKRPFNWAEEFPEVMSRGGFDVVAGNPPYVRIQSLPEVDRDYFRDHFETSFGSFDLYILFIEQAIKLLKQDGYLGFITSGKFLKSAYGHKVCHYISQHGTVDQLVDPSALQVFGGATTYPILLIFHKRKEERMLYYALLRKEPQAGVGGLGDPGDRDERMAPQDAILKGMWPPPGERQPLVDKLFAGRPPLGAVADRIFQGLVTGADRVYTVDEVSREGALVLVTSRQTATEHELEQVLLKPLLSGPNIHRYVPPRSQHLLLFPYQIEGDKAFLISPKDFEDLYPKTWAYLLENRSVLESREGGKMHHERWYAFGRTQNLALHGHRKLAVPRLVHRLCAFYDEQGQYYLDNVDVGGILLKEQDHKTHCYVTGLLNSRLLDYCHSLVSAPFRGGYRSANRQFLEVLPVHTIDSGNLDETGMYDQLVALVEQMMRLSQRKAELSSQPNEVEDLERLLTQTDREIDKLVYDLYGLTEDERRSVEETVER